MARTRCGLGGSSSAVLMLAGTLSIPAAVAAPPPGGWRDPALRATLVASDLEVALRAGIPYLIRSRATGMALIERKRPAWVRDTCGQTYVDPRESVLRRSSRERPRTEGARRGRRRL